MSRRENESIVINDDITIVVVEIRGDKVRLGIEAPKEVPVHRNEVYEAIRRNWDRGSSMPVADHDLEPMAREEPRAVVASPLSLSPAALMEEVLREPERDGLCCPQCQSPDVRIDRIKVAYKGAELVRWRECEACGNKFQTLERVEAL
jgi:carbon storage regulator